jgi:hypothetical protein
MKKELFNYTPNLKINGAPAERINLRRCRVGTAHPFLRKEQQAAVVPTAS